jgi:cation:H+ antiporter
MWLNILLIITGLVLLRQGAAFLVKGSSGLARKFRVSELAIGLTIVAFGTSAPELVVNSFASFKSNYDIVFGNIIGSNIFNLFIILTIVALITPLRVQSSTAWKEIPFSFFAILLLFLLANDRLVFHRDISRISRFDGFIMIVAFALFLRYVFKQLKYDAGINYSEKGTEKTGIILVLIATGLAGLVLGGKLVLDNAVELASGLGMSEKLIGLTIVAAGTSLPELATSVVAAAKKNSDIAVGNIIGSNIFNILFILPVSSFIRPLKFDPGFNRDIGFIAGGTFILFIAMYTGKRMQIDRWEALILFLTYVAYIFLMIK